MAENRAIDIMAEIIIDNDFNPSKITIKGVTKNVMKVLQDWMTQTNVDLTDISDEVLKASYFDDELAYYVFSFSVNDPEMYVGRVIIEEGPESASLIGESSKVSG